MDLITHLTFILLFVVIRALLKLRPSSPRIVPSLQLYDLSLQISRCRYGHPLFLITFFLLTLQMESLQLRFSGLVN